VDIGESFIVQSRALLTDSYLPRIEQAIESLSVEKIWWRANDESNSIGNLMLHLEGNVRQWIISGLGRAADVRRRQAEFEQGQRMTGPGLFEKLSAAVDEAGRILATTDPVTLLEPRRIQTYDVTVMSAVYTVVEHFAMHTGQIILLAKMWKGDLALYDMSSGNPRPTWKGGVEGH
jgi:uncharacterized damage-inducible protein DinB